jgi:hypothetical protein
MGGVGREVMDNEASEEPFGEVDNLSAINLRGNVYLF